MNFALWLSLTITQEVVTLLPRRCKGKAFDASYALDGGRVILKVLRAPDDALAGEHGSAQTPCETTALFLNENELATPKIHLAASLSGKIKRAMRHLTVGLERPLMAQASSMVAAGLFSFALSALVLGTSAPLRAQELPKDASRQAQCVVAGGEMLLADLGPGDKIPHHAFRRGSNIGDWNQHVNVPKVHYNNANDPNAHYNASYGKGDYLVRDENGNDVPQYSEEGKPGLNPDHPFETPMKRSSH